MNESNALLRDEYPRPQFVRSSWLNLNGEWEFEFDDGRIGEKQSWYSAKHGTFSRTIQVPFCYQSSLSGIGETAFHDVVWYRREFTLPDEFAGKNVVLHFGAVDYQAKVWVNGQLVAMHEGGHVPFQADITTVLRTGSNVVTIRAYDPSTDLTIPRGKQYWQEQSASIFYTRTTGIWQTVWIEAVNPISIRTVKFTPDLDTNAIKVDAFLNGFSKDADLRLKVKITYKGAPVAEDLIRMNQEADSRSISLNSLENRENRWWSPGRPNLYDAEFTLFADGRAVDTVQSYFGMRKISIENGKVCLNHRPFYLKMVLDQGYFPDGILTAPSDAALRQDVELTKAMGFNGARKHQKVEDPRYLYWCDQLGLVVWGEMANSYLFTDQSVRRMTSEWQQVIERDYNHPCLIAWVPINESWGVPNIQWDQAEQHHALSLYHLTKSLDPTRLVISNDGWEHVKSDLCTIHDYEWRRDVLESRYSSTAITDGKPGGRSVYAYGHGYQGEPILVTEFGGISFKKSDWEGWGYSGAHDDQDFTERFTNVVHALLKSPLVQGYCYTQLTDVEQEINGLLTYDRQPKIPLETIKRIQEEK